MMIHLMVEQTKKADSKNVTGFHTFYFAKETTLANFN